jgi:hypothetical protein
LFQPYILLHFNVQRNTIKADKTGTFCDVLPCCLTDYQHFRGIHTLHLQDLIAFTFKVTLKMEAVHFSENNGNPLLNYM